MESKPIMSFDKPFVNNFTTGSSNTDNRDRIRKLRAKGYETKWKIRFHEVRPFGFNGNEDSSFVGKVCKFIY